MVTEEKATLRIFRRKQLINKMQPFSIFVNNAKVGDVKNGQEFDIQVPPGNCTIQARLFWCKSKPIQAQLTSGSVSDFEVGCKVGILSNIEAMIRALIPYAFLYLEEIEIIDE